MADQQSPFQQVIGSKITKFVLWGTAIIGLTGIVFAFIAINSDAEKVKTAFSIVQYIFGALLPLWGTWIGTILAYYYSKENFESANKNVQQIVDKLTSDQKLGSLKAKDVMIPRAKLIVKTMAKGQTLADFKIQEDCFDFMATNKIKRVLILDDQDRALYAIHRELIAVYVAQEAGKAGGGFNMAALTLDTMHKNASAEIINTMDNSVKFIGENATLLEAKNIMQQFQTCQDVFVTQNGQAQDPVLGWITNVTITQNSVV